MSFLDIMSDKEASVRGGIHGIKGKAAGIWQEPEWLNWSNFLCG